MIYNINYDICAVVISLLAMVFLLFCKNLKKTSNRIFLAILVLCLFSAVADIVSSIANSYVDRYQEVYRNFWNYSYLFLHNSMAGLYLLYEIFVLNLQDKLKKWQYAVLAAPLCGTLGALMLNPLFHWVFYYDENGIYSHGMMINLLFANAFFYLIAGMLFAVLFKKALEKKAFYLLLLFIVLCVVPIAIQIRYQHLLIELFFQSIGLCGVMFSIEPDDELMRRLLGLEREERQKTDWKAKWLFPLQRWSVFLILTGVLCNLAGRALAGYLSLPLWLDAVGTLIAAVELGPAAGAITGALSNIILGCFSHLALLYTPVSIGVGVTIGFFFPRGKKKEMFFVVATAVFAGFVAAALSTPLNMMLYDGYTGNLWGDALYDMLYRDIHVRVICCIFAEAFVDMPDKALSMVLAVFAADLLRYIPQKRIKKEERMLLLFFAASASIVFVSGQAEAAEGKIVDYSSEYESVSYDSDDGLLPSEINAVAQTSDGYIWAGTYSGLYRYDGSKFEKMMLDERINSVMALLVDRRNRLWIGTNDCGIGCYDVSTGEIVFYSTSDGLTADSIRSICEDGDGGIYIGTAGSLCRIGKEGMVDAGKEWESLTYVKSLACGKDGLVSGVTNAGELFFLKNGKLAAIRKFTKQEGVYYTAVTAAGNGQFLVGTSTSLADRVSFDQNEIIVETTTSTGPVSYINDLCYDAGSGSVFLCGEKGLGALGANGRLMDLKRTGFDSSISDVIMDYQGNIWFASSKQGIMKYARNSFHNTFKKAGLSEQVVNCLAERDEELFIGTDDGLFVLDLNTGKQKKYAYLESFSGVRIRHILSDSKGNLWMSTYGKDGLVRIDSEGNLTSYNETTGMMGGRFRSAIELRDGRILAASNMGLTYLQNGHVEETIGEADGLSTPQILTMVEKEDGTILAGSDGGGIYVIQGQIVTGQIDAASGLASLVVLRIIPYKQGYFYVTSNAIYYDDGTNIRRLDRFPYTNNYDITITQKGDAWISSSAGIYIVDADELVRNDSYSYTLLNRSKGFYTTLTANAWNAMYGSWLFLCCSDGVRQIDTQNYNYYDDDFSIRISSIYGGDEKVQPDGNVFVIPQEAERIQIQVAILNFTLSNPRIHMFLEGTQDTGITCNQLDMMPLSFTNLPYGDYRLHVQILDEVSDTLLREETFEIRKEAQLFERLSFKIYLLSVCTIFVVFLAWMVAKLGSMAIINRQYEQIRQAKEEAEEANQAKSRFLANMSHEIRTPINAIMGMDELILRGEVSPDVREYASDIRQASGTLLDIVNDILDLSKIESGKMPLFNQEYDLAELLSTLLMMMKVRCDEKMLSFQTDVDGQIPRHLLGDEVRLRQVLLNLLSNAVKYTETGEVTLTVKLAERDEKTATLFFAVKDTGTGIRKEDKERLFEPFERLDEKKNRHIQGTGLGLNITRQLVEMMGGTLLLESVYGEGSVFSFAIRQECVSDRQLGLSWQEEKRTEHGEAARGALFTAAKARILVVDDNELNLAVIKGLLKRTKMQVDTVGSGQECLERLGGEPYDLLLLDHMMPNMDGIETFHEIRNRGILLPVIILTANATMGAREMYLTEGFDDYLTKPVEGELLEEMILKYLPREKVLRNEGRKKKDRAEKKKLPMGNGKPLILIVDDETFVTKLAAKLLKPHYEVCIANSGEEGIHLAAKQTPDLILLDIKMPGMDGFEVMKRLKSDQDTREIPVIFLTGDENRDTEVRGFKAGVSDFVRKPFVPEVLLQRVRRIVELSHLQNYLQEEVSRQTQKVGHLTREIMLALAKTVDAKDHYTNGHSQRVARYSVEIAKRLGKSVQEQEEIYAMGLLHDVGKIGISGAIINKTSRLTEEEYTEIKTHTTIGYDILKTITEMPGLATGARWHHERYDGHGYPDGLSGEEIPEAARIICVADCYDAMTSKRSYSKVREQALVREEILRCKGTQFDPVIADVMIAMIDADVDYQMSERDAAWPDAAEETESKKENQVQAKDASSKKEKEVQAKDAVILIPQIDTREGVRNCGSEEGFLDALEIFRETIQEKAEEIRKYYDAGDWKNYTIKVHALKSSARIIGATELSELAKELEEAGHKEDVSVIETKNGRLLEMYQSYTTLLQPDD